MKSIYLYTLAIAMAGMAGTLWADDPTHPTNGSAVSQPQGQGSSGGVSAGLTHPGSPTHSKQKGKTVKSRHLTKHDQAQVTGNLNGAGKTGNAVNPGKGYIKGKTSMKKFSPASPNGKNGKTGNNGGITSLKPDGKNGNVATDGGITRGKPAEKVDPVAQ